jgi:hypothetical protein
VSNTRKETCPHCDGCGYVEVLAPREDAEPISVKRRDVLDAQDIAKIEGRIERLMIALRRDYWKEYFSE